MFARAGALVQALSRAKHFIRVNKETSKMTIEELKEKASTDTGWLERNCERYLLSVLWMITFRQHCTQNLVGSKSYWKYQVRNRFREYFSRTHNDHSR